MNWYKISQTQALPPITPNHIRLTHFTSPQIATVLLQGGDFKYRGLNTTTDAFSSNQEVQSLISSGKTGAFVREGFGTSVVLIDLPYQLHRQLAQPTTNNDKIPNPFIVGIFDRNTNIFTSNPNFNPSIPFQVTSTTPSARTGNRPTSQNITNILPQNIPIPVPQNNSDMTEDVF